MSNIQSPINVIGSITPGTTINANQKIFAEDIIIPLQKNTGALLMVSCVISDKRKLQCTTNPNVWFNMNDGDTLEKNNVYNLFIGVKDTDQINFRFDNSTTMNKFDVFYILTQM